MKAVEKDWGNFRQFVLNKKCTVKILQVNANEELSYQRHKFRDEQWYIISGEGTVVIEGTKINYEENIIFKIKRGQAHRIKATLDTKVLEISFGDFDEEDIERLEDKYGRVK